jgi:hypothetical protein
MVEPEILEPDSEYEGETPAIVDALEDAAHRLLAKVGDHVTPDHELANAQAIVELMRAIHLAKEF